MNKVTPLDPAAVARRARRAVSALIARIQAGERTAVEVLSRATLTNGTRIEIRLIAFNCSGGAHGLDQ